MYIDADPILSNHPCIPTQHSRIKVINKTGRRLIELCQSTSYVIGNGRLHDDLDKGEFTYHSMNGSSVVDYLLLNIHDFDCVTDFQVLQQN